MSSPSISFNQIPSSVRKPGVYIEENVSNAIQGLTAKNDKIVIVAQRTSTGTVAEKIPTKVFSDADAQLYFGAGSIAHLAARAAIIANPYADLTVVGVDDEGGSTPAVGTISVGSVPTAGGTLYVYIGDVMGTVSYTGAEAASTIATAIATAVNIYSNLLPCTASPSSSDVDLEAKNAGTVGNFIPVTVADKNGTSWITITAMTTGATDPDLGDYASAGTVLASIVGGGYTIICNCLPNTESTYDAATKVKSMVNFVSGPMEQRPAIQVFAMTNLVDTYANTKTLCGTNLNDGRISVPWIDYTTGGLARSEFYKIAGAYAATIASQSDPAVPFDGLVLTGIAAPAVNDRLTRTVCEDALNAGVTPLQVQPGEQVAIVRAISTYTLNSLSIADPTLLDITTIRTLDYVRDQIRTRLSLRFQRSKLSPRILKSIKYEVIDVLYLLQGLEIVQNVDTYKSGVIVEVDSTDSTRADVKIPSNIVQGLHVIAAVIDLILG